MRWTLECGRNRMLTMEQVSMRPISLPKRNYTLACAQLMGFLGMLACRLTPRILLAGEV